MSSAQNTAHENRLAQATSPYLLQHQHNPVDWWQWGPEALAEAKRSNRPIMLSVGYAACHWCHVMAHESFEDEATARVMNELFVNIKVDREERPDIDQIYMNALHLLGEQGGWPLTMFLTPQAEPVWGGTYFPKEQRYGRPAFTDLFRLLAEQPRHLAQNIGESRPPVALLLWKISSAPHRLRLRREKHGQRPAALLAQEMQRVHVDLVDVRPLLAVDLDVDEQLVHHGCCRRVLERLVRHHVAPVAGGVADREQDRPIAALGLGQGLRPPLPPVHRIVLVLQQIGRGRGGQAIFVRGVLRRGHRRSLARITRQTNWPSV